MQHEVEKLYDSISWFKDSHLVAAVLKNGNPADVRDYEHFLKLHTPLPPPMSPASRATCLEHNSVMLQDSQDAEAEE